MTGMVQSKSGGSTHPAGKAVPRGTDRVALSGGNEEISRLSAMMQQIPDTSTEMVPQLKQLIGDGVYHAASRDVAEKMLDRWQDFAVQ